MQKMSDTASTRSFYNRMQDACVFHVFDAKLSGVANAKFERAYMLDTAVNEAFDNTGMEDLNLPAEDKLVTLYQFLTSLCVRQARERNLARIWEDHLDLLVIDDEDDRQMATIAEVGDYKQWSRAVASNFALDTANLIAQNHPVSDAGIAMTSIDFPHPYEGYATLHILINKAGETLMVGENISRQLKAALSAAGINYIGRNEKGAVTRAEEAVSHMLRDCPDDDVHERLLAAFLYRNACEDDGIDNPETLGSAMAGREYSMVTPKYICRF